MHSPVHDLESCFWVALWSVFLNKQHEGSLSPTELKIRGDLIKGFKDQAAMGLLCLPQTHCTDVMKCFHPVLQDWWYNVMAMRVKWRTIAERAPADAGEEYYLPHFHLSALQGAVDILEVMSKYWENELNWESWTPPSPPVASDSREK